MLAVQFVENFLERTVVYVMVLTLLHTLILAGNVKLFQQRVTAMSKVLLTDEGPPYSLRTS